MSDFLFYLFAVLAVISALVMVSARGAVTASMAMIATLVAVAADYFLLDAPFLGVLQILVYAGAVMVLFLFIVMLLDVDKAVRTPRQPVQYITGATLLIVFATLAVVPVVLEPRAVEGESTKAVSAKAAFLAAKPATPRTDAPAPAGAGAAELTVESAPEIPAQPIAYREDARSFGRGLFTKYMLPLQLAGFLLLAAMLAVVSLSKRPKA